MPIANAFEARYFAERFATAVEAGELDRASAVNVLSRLFQSAEKPTARLVAQLPELEGNPNFSPSLLSLIADAARTEE